MFSSYIYIKLSPAWKIISLANQKYDDYPVNYLPACAAALVLRFFVEFLGNTVGMYAGWVASSTFAPEIKMNPNCSFIHLLGRYRGSRDHCFYCQDSLL